nr:MAG TPA: hypothetical protein [Caudoviricetes sp.]
MPVVQTSYCLDVKVAIAVDIIGAALNCMHSVRLNC